MVTKRVVEVDLWMCPRCRLKWVHEKAECKFCPRCRSIKGELIPPSYKCRARVREVRLFGHDEDGYIDSVLCEECVELQHLTVVVPIPEQSATQEADKPTT